MNTTPLEEYKSPLMYIYMTKNKISGKIYVGQSMKDDESYLGSGTILMKALKRYGRENFERTILENCTDKAHMNEREKFWIEHYDSTNRTIGYNISTGGVGGYLGPEVSKKMAAKLSIRMKGNTYRLGKVPYNKGVPMSEAQREKMKQPKSEAHKKALSKAKIGKQLKPIRCITNSIEYPSVKAAAENLGLTVPNVVEVLKGRAGATKGFSFMYVNPVYPHYID